MGCVPRFETPEQMQAAIDEYFANPPTAVMRTKDGEPFEAPKITLSGMALALGFASIQSLHDYNKREGYAEKFGPVIGRARLRMSEYYEWLAQGGCPAGAIFMLKNLGFSDRQQTELSGPDGKDLFPNITVKYE